MVLNILESTKECLREPFQIGSRLPEFTEEERMEVAGAWDFLGFNIYTTDLIFSLPFDINFPNYYM